MKACPFCGSEPVVVSSYQRLRTDGPSSAQNLILREMRQSKKSGRIIGYVYDQVHFRVRCSNKKCIAYHLNHKVLNLDVATAEWDRRVGEAAGNEDQSRES